MFKLFVVRGKLLKRTRTQDFVEKVTTSDWDPDLGTDCRTLNMESDKLRTQWFVVGRKSSLIEDVDDLNGGGKRASIHPCKPFDIDTNHSLNTIMRAWDDFFILYPS